VKGNATSVEVTTALCKRAAIAQQCVNCLTEIFFEEAMARAKECDEYLKKNGRPMGPLHGLPISLKVSF
jgi:amidase